MINLKTLSGPREILVIRHGESVLNVHRQHMPPYKGLMSRLRTIHPKLAYLAAELMIRFTKGIPLIHPQSDAEAALTEAGRALSFLRAVSLLENNLIPDLIITSTYKRANQTAQIIRDVIYENTGQKIKLIVFSFLREKEAGNFFRVPLHYFNELEPDYKKEQIEKGKYFHRFQDGESTQDLVKRIDQKLNEVLTLAAPDSRVMFVAHGHVNMVLHGLLTGTDIQLLTNQNFFVMPNLDIKHYQLNHEKEKYQEVRQ